MSNNKEKESIETFFAEVMFGDDFYKKVNLQGELVIALQDSPFADTWSVFSSKENACKALKKLGDEMGKDMSNYIDRINSVSGFAARKVFFHTLKEVHELVNPPDNELSPSNKENRLKP